MTGWVEVGTSPEEGSVREAFRRWAAARALAPSGLDAQVVAVASRDEELARVATAVVRRELVEQRAPTTASARPTGTRVEAHAIDLFAHDLETLRRHTEHHAPCAGCAGRGRVACVPCGGSGRRRCAECGGSGHVTRYYKKSSRVIQCPGCRTKGTVRCDACGTSGEIACGACAGVGRQLVWWTYVDTRTVDVSLSSASPVLAGHPALRERRPAHSGDLAPFTTLACVDHPGPIPPERLSPDDRAIRDRLARPVDPRHERVEAEQYVRVAVLRRDVAYETCGMRGEVVLSGSGLVGADTDEAMRPLRTRATLWVGAAIALAVAGSLLRGSLHGPTAYFAAVNQGVTALTWLGFAAATVAAGGLLRAWRPGMRLWPMRRYESAAITIAIAATLTAPVARYAARPRAEEARAAFARNDVDRARVVVEALDATGGTVDPALRDDVDLAVARRQEGDARIATLDAIAARGASRSAEAAGLATQQRLETLRALLTARQHDEVLTRLDRWETRLRGRAEVASIRAGAFDLRAAACAGELCRMQALGAAHAAEPTPRRATARAEARQRLLTALAARPDEADVVARLERLSALASLAASASGVHDDPELATAARTAADHAREARGRIPLIGSPRAAVDTLLARPSAGAPATGWTDLAGIAVFTTETGNVCDGLYVVGDRAGGRALAVAEAGIRRLLAQIVGRDDPAPIARPRAGSAHAVTRWRDGDVAYVARWRDGVAIELRVGRAVP